MGKIPGPGFIPTPGEINLSFSPFFKLVYYNDNSNSSEVSIGRSQGSGRWFVQIGLVLVFSLINLLTISRVSPPRTTSCEAWFSTFDLCCLKITSTVSKYLVNTTSLQSQRDLAI